MRAMMRLTLVSIVCAFWWVSALASDQNGTSDWSKLPATAQAKVSAALGGEASDYYARPVSGGYETGSSWQGMSVRFSTAGVEVRSGDARWGMTLRGYGHGDALHNVRVVAPQASKNRVEYRRGSVTEWYLNGPAGLEQGFTIERRPQGNTSRLTIALELSGELTATADDGGAGLELADDSGREQMRYTGLTAYDAGGKELRTSLELQGRKLRLRVNDAGARYPIVVDPIVQLAKLTASDGGPQNAFGVSVSVSGNVVVAGTVVNAAYVFVKPASGWQNMTQTAKLTPSDGVEGDMFGRFVAISGNVIVVGAPQATVNGNVFQGAAYVFVRPTGGWRDTTETAKLVASDGAAGDALGEVAVSGRTVIVGAPLAAVNGTFNQGAAYVFEPPMGEGSSDSRVILTETAKLTASDSLPGGSGALFGSDVAINGNTVAVGALEGNGGLGEAYVFVKPASGWADGTQTAALKSSDLGGLLGASIATNGTTNGTTVVAGAPLAGSPGSVQGAVYVFVEPISGWANMTETAQLQTSTLLGPLGNSVAIDATGHNVLAGSPQGYGNRDDSGQVCVFVEPPSGWQTTSKANLRLFSSDGHAGDYFGFSISLSGRSLVVGADLVAATRGAAYLLAAE